MIVIKEGGRGRGQIEYKKVVVEHLITRNSKYTSDQLLLLREVRQFSDESSYDCPSDFRSNKSFQVEIVW
jgi:hypothetical protein